MNGAMSAIQLGSQLRKFLSVNDDLGGLEAWAHELHLSHRFSPEVDDVVMQLVMTGEGPQFELTREQLETLADVLVSGDHSRIRQQIRGQNAAD
jgi:hypothetical protein